MLIKTNAIERDNLTGEVLSSKSYHYQSTKTSEPKFVKMFVDDVAALNELSSPSTKVLNGILKEMNYNNHINLIKETKKELMDFTGMSLKHIEKSIMELKDKNILLTRGRAAFTVNPRLFGKGSWKDIEAIRMTIVYDENGKMVDIERLENKAAKQLKKEILENRIESEEVTEMLVNSDWK